MKITVLVENNSRIDRYLLSEPALSLYIETENKRILFDTGYSDILIKNAKTLGINLAETTDIILSHGHDDHSGGLRFLDLNNKKTTLIAHPNIFDEKSENGLPYGCPISQEELNKKYTLTLTKTPFRITNNLIFLGEIENNTTKDIDDSALVYIAKEGLVIITGCSHTGIINIINYAKKVTGIKKIHAVLGGFHLINKKPSEIDKISEVFNTEGIKFIAPCHCCDLNSKIDLAKHCNIKEICTGDVIQF